LIYNAKSTEWQQLCKHALLACFQESLAVANCPVRAEAMLKKHKCVPNNSAGLFNHIGPLIKAVCPFCQKNHWVKIANTN
jgi:hypothetical protein